jgi:hypothetical protein
MDLSNEVTPSNTLSLSDMVSGSLKLESDLLSLTRDLANTGSFEYSNVALGSEFLSGTAFNFLGSNALAASEYVVESEQFKLTVDIEESLYISQTVLLTPSNTINRSPTFARSNHFSHSAHAKGTQLQAASAELGNSLGLVDSNCLSKTDSYEMTSELLSADLSQSCLLLHSGNLSLSDGFGGSHILGLTREIPESEVFSVSLGFPISAAFLSSKLGLASGNVTDSMSFGIQCKL